MSKDIEYDFIEKKWVRIGIRIPSNAEKRAERLRAAREKATHTKAEWIEMVEFFEHTCARCFGESGLMYVEKDHITPLYQGGSDGIENLQPLCARCNTSKGADNTDLRPQLAAHLNKVLPANYTKQL